MKTKRTVNLSKMASELIIACALFLVPFTGFASEGDSLNQRGELLSGETIYRGSCAADFFENSEMEVTLEHWMLDVDAYLNSDEEAEIKLETWMTDLDDPFWAEVDTKANPELAFESWMANPDKW